jgi:hypothetical protein
MSLVGGSGVIHVSDAYMNFQDVGGGITLADGTSVISGTAASFGSGITSSADLEATRNVISDNVVTNVIHFGDSGDAPAGVGLDLNNVVARNSETESPIIISTGASTSLNTSGESNLQSITTTSISLDSTAATPGFSAGTLTVDGAGKVYSLHHYQASADITTITATNMNDGDQFVASVVNTTGSNIEISTGGTDNKSSFDEPANVEASQTAVLVGIRLIGNMHYSVTVFS